MLFPYVLKGPYALHQKKNFNRFKDSNCFWQEVSVPEKVKYLYVYINRKLFWNAHIDKLHQKARKS